MKEIVVSKWHRVCIKRTLNNDLNIFINGVNIISDEYNKSLKVKDRKLKIKKIMIHINE